MSKNSQTEVAYKLMLVRNLLRTHDLGGIRLRGSDWFAWATGGGSNIVLLTSEVGVAEVLITADEAFVVTDAIEAQRLRDEEISSEYQLWQGPWQDPEARERFVRELSQGRLLASDRPRTTERGLPGDFIKAKLQLLPEEIARYRALGTEAAEAMTETLTEAQANWTARDLAARGASALWRRGIHPALILVGDSRRLPIYRHPTVAAERLGDRAMLVFCARRHGLFANLTRFVYFRDPTAVELENRRLVAEVEADIFRASRPGTTLGSVYEAMSSSYQRLGQTEEILKHHQGGLSGYRAREEIALPHAATVIERNMALAWNPSLTGTKIEDTALVTGEGVEILTVDPTWPTFIADKRARPDYLVKK